MPNHITNILRIGQNIFEYDPTVRKRKEAERDIHFDAIRGYCQGPESEMDFDKIIPGRPSSENGGNAWYHWSIEKWGTKWNAYKIACAITNDSELLYHFQTAWSPPLPVLDELALMFPDLWFSLIWLDEGDDKYETINWSSGKRDA